MSNNFCRFLSNGYSFTLANQSVVLKPCCWYNGGIKIDENLSERINNRSKINDWSRGCKVCEMQENVGQPSFRQSSFDIIPDVDSTIPLALDINLDMNCNAACVICGPDASTLWAKKSADHKVIDIKKDYAFEHHLDYILENFDLSAVRRVKFFGGEPLLTTTHLKVLEKIPNASQCDIWYTTNASILPDAATIDLWTKFNRVFFEASIDAIGKRFDYIRWPLKWHKISKNLLELKKIGPSNLLFRINHTLNPFNIFYYDELEDWVEKNLSTNRLGSALEINVHPCWGQWDLTKTPSSLRAVIFEKYPNSLISNMMQHLDIKPYDSITEFTSTYDSVRNNCWKQVFPEIVEHFS